MDQCLKIVDGVDVLVVVGVSTERRRRMREVLKYLRDFS